MPRKLIKRYLPDPSSVKDNRYLKIFGNLLHDPQLWHLTRYSVSYAFAIGLFCAFIPIPFQMFLAAGAAVVIRANLPLSIALVWVTNPITMPVIFGFAYWVGTLFIADTSGSEFAFELSWNWLAESLGTIWQPFLLGCLICAFITGVAGYAGIRIFWRLHVVSQWQERKLKRVNTQTN